MSSSKAVPIGPPLWVSVLIYMLLSVLMTWSLVMGLDTHVPSTDTDVFNVYWGNWWVRYALGNGLNLYQTQHLIYPVGFDLVSFAFSPFLALLWIPLSWVLPALAAYNLVMLLTIVLCCVAMDQLLRYLTGNGWAALVGAITFGFAPALVAERACHLNLATLFWIPWTALLLTRLMREARLRDAILLIAAVGLAFLTRIQVGIMVLLFAAVYGLGLALVEGRQWPRLAYRRLLLSGLGILLVLAPLLVYGWQSLDQPGGETLLRGEADHYQTDLLAYVLPPQQHPVWGELTAGIYQEQFQANTQYWAYIGLVPLVLAVYAALSRPRKALPWLLVGLLFFVLALGPSLRFNGVVYDALKLPYYLAQGLFSIMGLNWPNRFNLGLMAAVGVLVGLACAGLYDRVRKPWPLAVVALLILVEFLVVPWPAILAPPDSDFYEQMAADGEEYAIVDLPLTRHDGEVHRYYQTIHHKPIVGGWDHRIPAGALTFVGHNALLGPWIDVEHPDVPLDQALAGLSEANVRYFLIHKNQMVHVPAGLRTLLATQKPVYQDWSVLALPVDNRNGQAYNVVERFGPSLALVRPATYLYLPWDGRPPLLSLDLCWLAQGPGAGADKVRITLSSDDGGLVYEQVASLPPLSAGLACHAVHMEPDSIFPDGDYELGITPLAGEQVLGTYTNLQSIFNLETRRGESFPAMGRAAPVAFDAPIELLGYNLVRGEGFVWVDLYWRSTVKHEGSYDFQVQLVDPRSGLNVASAEGTIQKDRWRKRDLFQERMVLWLDVESVEQLSLGIELEDVPALDPRTGQPLPQGPVLLDALPQAE